jgi:DNA-directed RNA polymerase specialized sigma24 family protein
MNARSPAIQESLSRMTEAEWKDIYKRVRLFAYKNYGWLQVKISGLDIETVIQDAVEDTLFGLRRWPAVDEDGNDKNVSLCVFLCQTVRSKISHLLEQQKNKVSIDENPEDEKLEVLFQSYLSGFRSGQGSEQQAIYNQLSVKLIEAVHPDTLLTQIVKLYIDMPDLKPSDVAERLGIPVKEVLNAQRRLVRKTQKLREEWING